MTSPVCTISEVTYNNEKYVTFYVTNMKIDKLGKCNNISCGGNEYIDIELTHGVFYFNLQSKNIKENGSDVLQKSSNCTARIRYRNTVGNETIKEIYDTIYVSNTFIEVPTGHVSFEWCKLYENIIKNDSNIFGDVAGPGVTKYNSVQFTPSTRFENRYDLTISDKIVKISDAAGNTIDETFAGYQLSGANVANLVSDLPNCTRERKHIKINDKFTMRVIEDSGFTICMNEQGILRQSSDKVYVLSFRNQEKFATYEALYFTNSNTIVKITKQKLFDLIGQYVIINVAPPPIKTTKDEIRESKIVFRKTSANENTLSFYGFSNDCMRSNITSGDEMNYNNIHIIVKDDILNSVKNIIDNATKAHIVSIQKDEQGVKYNFDAILINSTIIYPYITFDTNTIGIIDNIVSTIGYTKTGGKNVKSNNAISFGYINNDDVNVDASKTVKTIDIGGNKVYIYNNKIGYYGTFSGFTYNKDAVRFDEDSIIVGSSIVNISTDDTLKVNVGKDVKNNGTNNIEFITSNNNLVKINCTLKTFNIGDLEFEMEYILTETTGYNSSFYDYNGDRMVYSSTVSSPKYNLYAASFQFCVNNQGYAEYLDQSGNMCSSNDYTFTSENGNKVNIKNKVITIGNAKLTIDTTNHYFTIVEQICKRNFKLLAPSSITTITSNGESITFGDTSNKIAVTSTTLTFGTSKISYDGNEYDYPYTYKTDKNTIIFNNENDTKSLIIGDTIYYIENSSKFKKIVCNYSKLSFDVSDVVSVFTDATEREKSLTLKTITKTNMILSSDMTSNFIKKFNAEHYTLSNYYSYPFISKKILPTLSSVVYKLVNIPGTDSFKQAYVNAFKADHEHCSTIKFKNNTILYNDTLYCSNGNITINSSTSNVLYENQSFNVVLNTNNTNILILLDKYISGSTRNNWKSRISTANMAECREFKPKITHSYSNQLKQIYGAYSSPELNAKCFMIEPSKETYEITENNIKNNIQSLFDIISAFYPTVEYVYNDKTYYKTLNSYAGKYNGDKYEYTHDNAIVGYVINAVIDNENIGIVGDYTNTFFVTKDIDADVIIKSVDQSTYTYTNIYNKNANILTFESRIKSLNKSIIEQWTINIYKLFIKKDIDSFIETAVKEKYDNIYNESLIMKNIIICNDKYNKLDNDRKNIVSNHTLRYDIMGVLNIANIFGIYMEICNVSDANLESVIEKIRLLITGRVMIELMKVKNYVDLDENYRNIYKVIEDIKKTQTICTPNNNKYDNILPLPTTDPGIGFKSNMKDIINALKTIVSDGLDGKLSHGTYSTDSYPYYIGASVDRTVKYSITYNLVDSTSTLPSGTPHTSDAFTITKDSFADSLITEIKNVSGTDKYGYINESSIRADRINVKNNTMISLSDNLTFNKAKTVNKIKSIKLYDKQTSYATVNNINDEYCDYTLDIKSGCVLKVKTDNIKNNIFSITPVDGSIGFVVKDGTLLYDSSLNNSNSLVSKFTNSTTSFGAGGIQSCTSSNYVLTPPDNGSISLKLAEKTLSNKQCMSLKSDDLKITIDAKYANGISNGNTIYKYSNVVLKYKQLISGFNLSDTIDETIDGVQVNRPYSYIRFRCMDQLDNTAQTRSTVNSSISFMFDDKSEKEFVLQHPAAVYIHIREYCILADTTEYEKLNSADVTTTSYGTSGLKIFNAVGSTKTLIIKLITSGNPIRVYVRDCDVFMTRRCNLSIWFYNSVPIEIDNIWYDVTDSTTIEKISETLPSDLIGSVIVQNNGLNDLTLTFEKEAIITYNASFGSNSSESSSFTDSTNDIYGDSSRMNINSEKSITVDVFNAEGPSYADIPLNSIPSFTNTGGTILIDNIPSTPSQALSIFEPGDGVIVNSKDANVDYTCNFKIINHDLYFILGLSIVIIRGNKITYYISSDNIIDSFPINYTYKNITSISLQNNYEYAITEDGKSYTVKINNDTKEMKIADNTIDMYNIYKHETEKNNNIIISNGTTDGVIDNRFTSILLGETGFFSVKGYSYKFTQQNISSLLKCINYNNKLMYVRKTDLYTITGLLALSDANDMIINFNETNISISKTNASEIIIHNGETVVIKYYYNNYEYKIKVSLSASDKCEKLWLNNDYWLYRLNNSYRWNNGNTTYPDLTPTNLVADSYVISNSTSENLQINNNYTKFTVGDYRYYVKTVNNDYPTYYINRKNTDAVTTLDDTNTSVICTLIRYSDKMVMKSFIDFDVYDLSYPLDVTKYGMNININTINGDSGNETIIKLDNSDSKNIKIQQNSITISSQLTQDGCNFTDFNKCNFNTYDTFSSGSRGSKGVEISIDERRKNIKYGDLYISTYGEKIVSYKTRYGNYKTYYGNNADHEIKYTNDNGDIWFSNGEYPGLGVQFSSFTSKHISPTGNDYNAIYLQQTTNVEIKKGCVAIVTYNSSTRTYTNNVIICYDNDSDYKVYCSEWRDHALLNELSGDVVVATKSSGDDDDVELSMIDSETFSISINGDTLLLQYNYPDKIISISNVDDGDYMKNYIFVCYFEDNYPDQYIKYIDTKNSYCTCDCLSISMVTDDNISLHDIVKPNVIESSYKNIYRNVDYHLEFSEKSTEEGTINISDALSQIECSGLGIININEKIINITVTSTVLSFSNNIKFRFNGKIISIAICTDVVKFTIENDCINIYNNKIQTIIDNTTTEYTTGTTQSSSNSIAFSATIGSYNSILLSYSISSTEYKISIDIDTRNKIIKIVNDGNNPVLSFDNELLFNYSYNSCINYLYIYELLNIRYIITSYEIITYDVLNNTYNVMLIDNMNIGDNCCREIDTTFAFGGYIESPDTTELEIKKDTKMKIRCKSLSVKNGNDQSVIITNNNSVLNVGNIKTKSSITNDNVIYDVTFSGDDTISNSTIYKCITKTDGGLELIKPVFNCNSVLQWCKLTNFTYMHIDSFEKKNFNSTTQIIPIIVEYYNVDPAAPGFDIHNIDFSEICIPSDYKFSDLNSNGDIFPSSYHSNSVSKLQLPLQNPPEFLVHTLKTQKFDDKIITFVGPPFLLELSLFNSNTTANLQITKYVYGCYATIHSEGTIYNGVAIDKYFIVLRANHSNYGVNNNVNRIHDDNHINSLLTYSYTSSDSPVSNILNIIQSDNIWS